VVLLTNAPRPWREVAAQIEGLGIPRDAWDAIATSGDSARLAMFEGAVGRRVYFIGEERDLGFFGPMHLAEDAPEIERVPLDGGRRHRLHRSLRPQCRPGREPRRLPLRQDPGLKLLCANPDIVVDRGESREWCAGALAALYTEMGGESLYFGKPHPPVYDLARRRLSEHGGSPPDTRILAIGDGIRTDILGAQGEDIDSLFVTGGLAALETGTGRQPDPDALAAFLDAGDDHADLRDRLLR
jgi:ribonucleotide monophosphatase NagD (HAD superfamily)